MLLNKPPRKFNQLARETSGNVAIIAALAIIPIISVLGFAVDWQLVVTKKNSVQHTLDATLIAAARERQAGVSNEEVLANANLQFRSLVDVNEPSLTCGDVGILFNEGENTIDAQVRCTQPTTLSAIFGRTEVDFEVRTGSTFDIGQLDVAFVFDLSGSMNRGGRLDDLKDAANVAIDILLPEDRSPLDEVRLSIATYNHAVNAGSFFDQTVDFIERSNTIINSEQLGDQYEDLVGRVQFERNGSEQRPFWSYETANNNFDFAARAFYEPTCVYDRRGPLAASDEAPQSGSTLDRDNDTFLTVGHPLWDFSPNRNESSGVLSDKRDAEDEIHRIRTDFRLNGGYTPRVNSLQRSSGIQFNDVNQDNVIESEENFTYSAHLNEQVNDNFPLEACRPDNEPVPLTKDAELLKEFIEDMTAGGGTAGHLGIAWGWYLISPKWDQIWPSDSRPTLYTEADAAKAMILMTDGAFNATHPLDEKSSTELSADYCDAIKDETNIVIFTVGFRVPTNVDTVEGSSGQTILEYCATSPAFAFEANNGSELEDAYRLIAATISDLRLSQ